MVISLIEIKVCQKKGFWEMILVCKVQCQVLMLLMKLIARRMPLVRLPSPKNIKLDCSSPKVMKKREKFSGFRTIDTELLSKMLPTLPCKNCYELKLELHESPKKRKGLASCSSCIWESESATSERIGFFSEVNRRFIFGINLASQGLYLRPALRQRPWFRLVT